MASTTCLYRLPRKWQMDRHKYRDTLATAPGLTLHAFLSEIILHCFTSNTNTLKICCECLKCISSCEIDLVGNGSVDFELLADTSRGRKLLALINTGGGYQAHIVAGD